MDLLNKGMQHSIEQTMELYWNVLIIETEHAIKKLGPKTQEAYRKIPSKKLKQIKNSENHKNIYAILQSQTAST
jgi:hypothetical protein